MPAEHGQITSALRCLTDPNMVNMDIERCRWRECPYIGTDCQVSAMQEEVD